MNEFHRRVSQLYAKFCTSVKPNMPDITHKTLKVDGDLSGLQQYISDAYFPKALFEDVSRYIYRGIKVNHKIKDVQVQCQIYYLPNKTSKKKLRLLFEILSFMVFYCRSLSTHSILHLNINLILSPINKRITSGTFDAYHVNSGYTTLHESPRSASVIIYRREEVIKVLIHELLHSFAMDVKNYTRDVMLLKQMGFDFEIMTQRGIRLNEALTDAYACLLNVCLTSVVYKHDFKLFTKLLAKERDYICRIGRHVADMLGIPNTHTYVETTHVLSYYVIKALIFNHLQGFITDVVNNRFHITLKSLRLVNASELSTLHTQTRKQTMPKSIRMSSVDILTHKSKILKSI